MGCVTTDRVWFAWRMAFGSGFSVGVFWTRVIDSLVSGALRSGDQGTIYLSYWYGGSSGAL